MKIEPRINTNSVILAKAGIKTNVNSVNPCLPREMPLRLSHRGKSVSKGNRVNLRLAFSLVELLVVIAVIASLVALAIPAINAMQKSYDSTGTVSMISAALSTARSLAISHQQYAGVRFQKVYDKKGPLEANQYMIFIVYDSNEETGWVCGFVAVEGYKPVKLPENIGVIDKIILHRSPGADCDCTLSCVENPLTAADLDDSPSTTDPNGNNRNITDISAFSILFSPAGKLVIQKLRCGGEDDIFNTKNNIEANPPVGMFLEDDYENYGIGVENSRREFYIYDRNKFEKMPATGVQRWNYLNGLEPMYINPYTGEIIK